MPYPLSGAMLIISCSELCLAGFERPSPPIDDAVQSAWENHLLPTLEDGFDETGYSILAVGVVSTVIANNQDSWIRREWRGEQKVSRDVTEFGAVWGSGGPSLLMAGALLYYDRPSGVAFTEGVAMTSVTHFAISRLAGRRRPGNPLIQTSFPSGHTANAWAMATSLSYLYGWKLAVPTYSAAVLTMAARIADDRHWLSDTVAAAALGTFWGRAAYLHHDEKNLRVQPMISWHACGVGISYDF